MIRKPRDKKKAPVRVIPSRISAAMNATRIDNLPEAIGRFFFTGLIEVSFAVENVIDDVDTAGEEAKQNECP